MSRDLDNQKKLQRRSFLLGTSKIFLSFLVFSKLYYLQVLKNTKYGKLSDLNRESLEPIIKNLIEKHETNFKGVGQPLRIGLVGTKFGPGIYDIILSLDKTDVINRLKKLV